MEDELKQTKSVYEINENGYILGIVQVGEDMADGYVDTPYQGGLYVPRWNGARWVEGGTPPEQTPSKPTIEERLNAVETDVVTVKEILEVIYG